MGVSWGWEGYHRWTLVLLFLLDICVPPTTVPATQNGLEDRLGALHILTIIWALPLSAQIFTAVLGTALAMMIWQHVFGFRSSNRTDFSSVLWVRFGAAVGYSGWALRLWAKRTLSDRFTYRISNPGTLITDGPFRWFVHPGYAGAIYHLCGIVLVGVSALKRPLRLPACLTVVCLGCSALYLRIQDEEAMLLNVFGDRWTAHVAARWRLMPLIW